MLRLMHKEVAEAEALLRAAVQKCRDAGATRDRRCMAGGGKVRPRG
jgi:hypothetical protein